MDVEIHVDRGLCIGSGQCVHVAPRTFDQDEQALAYVTDPTGEEEDRIVRAIVACPMQAISLRVGGTSIGAAELRDWMRGIRSHDPLVEVLGRFSEAHHELREALVDPSSGDAATIGSMTRAHLSEEEGAYEAITRLVDPALVDTFDADHAHIVRALARLEDLAGEGGDDGDRALAASELATTLEDHIRLEETVLFPLALAALGREGAVPSAAG